MQRAKGCWSVDRGQQRSRWLGFPVAVMGKFHDDHGGALTTAIADNTCFALFPLLLVVVTVLGFLLGHDSGFQQRLLDQVVDRAGRHLLVANGPEVLDVRIPVACTGLELLSWSVLQRHQRLTKNRLTSLPAESRARLLLHWANHQA